MKTFTFAMAGILFICIVSINVYLLKISPREALEQIEIMMVNNEIEDKIKRFDLNGSLKRQIIHAYVP